jgi:hypothetical protein
MDLQVYSIISEENRVHIKQYVAVYLQVNTASHTDTFTAARTSSLILNMEAVTYLRNVGIYHPDYSALQVRRTKAAVKNYRYCEIKTRVFDL